MNEPNSFTTYSLGECRTAIGQVIEFTCRPDEVSQIREFIEKSIRTISTPVTGNFVKHGSYRTYTRYKIIQHKYAGGGPGDEGGWGYIEVLEMSEAPDGRCGIVINECTSLSGSIFTEWETLEHAITAFEKSWNARNRSEVLQESEGFKRRVICGELTPWFYAIGDEKLIGDYAFPEGLQDDPTYRFGRKFVVYDQGGIPSVKTCMGTRLHEHKQNDYPNNKYQYRIVYWDDGSMWDESGRHSWWSIDYDKPRPIEEGEIWITEAIKQFKQLLAGKSTDLTINFTDGDKFVGKLIRHRKQSICYEGDYNLVVHVKGKKQPLKGWVRDFTPSHESPDIVKFVTNKYAEKGLVIERIEIVESKVKRGGKKWAGVFFKSSQ